MSDFHLPLSGPVNQDISPFRNWAFSFFTVNLGRSSAPDVEEAALGVASYGRQLGRASEALNAVIEQLEADPGRTFTKEQKEAFEDFKSLFREIQSATKDARKQPRQKTWMEKWFV